MMPVLIGLFVLGLCIPAALTVRHVLKDQRDRRERWEAIADELGLEHFGGGRRNTSHLLAGTVNGFPVHIETRPNDEIATTLCSVQLPVNDAPLMSIVLRSTTGKVLDQPLVPNRFERPKQEQTFAQLLQVDAPDPVAAEAFLTEARRDAITKLFDDQLLGSTRVTNTEIETSTRGVVPRPTAVVSIVASLIDAAAALSPPRDTPSAATGRGQHRESRPYLTPSKPAPENDLLDDDEDVDLDGHIEIDLRDGAEDEAQLADHERMPWRGLDLKFVPRD